MNRNTYLLYDEDGNYITKKNLTEGEARRHSLMCVVIREDMLR